jgi:hypothetical protein
VSRFWKRTNVEGDRPAYRPRPRAEFARALADDVRSNGRPVAGRLRLGLAVGLALTMLVALAGFGGLGQAANGVKAPAKVLKGVFIGKSTKNRPNPYAHTPANNQYRGMKCLIRHKGRIIEVAGEAVPAHLRHGDQVISCRPR